MMNEQTAKPLYLLSICALLLSLSSLSWSSESRASTNLSYRELTDKEIRFVRAYSQARQLYMENMNWQVRFIHTKESLGTTPQKTEAYLAEKGANAPFRQASQKVSESNRMAWEGEGRFSGNAFIVDQIHTNIIDGREVNISKIRSFDGVTLRELVTSNAYSDTRPSYVEFPPDYSPADEDPRRAWFPPIVKWCTQASSERDPLGETYVVNTENNEYPTNGQFFSIMTRRDALKGHAFRCYTFESESGRLVSYNTQFPNGAGGRLISFDYDDSSNVPSVVSLRQEDRQNEVNESWQIISHANFGGRYDASTFELPSAEEDGKVVRKSFAQ